MQRQYTCDVLHVLHLHFPSSAADVASVRSFSCERFLHSFQASKLEKQSSMPESDYDNTFNDSEVDDAG